MIHFLGLLDQGTNNYFGMFYYLFLIGVVVFFAFLPISFLMFKNLLFRNGYIDRKSIEGIVDIFDVISVFVCVLLFIVTILFMSAYI